MPPKIELSDKQLDLIEKGLKQSWVLAIGAVSVLVAFVLLLMHLTPAQLGQ